MKKNQHVILLLIKAWSQIYWAAKDQRVMKEWKRIKIKKKKINKWSMIPRQCQVWALSVLSTLSSSINTPPPNPPPLSLSLSLTISLFSHCGTNYQLFFFFHIQPQFGAAPRLNTQMETPRSRGIHCFIWRAIMLKPATYCMSTNTQSHTLTLSLTESLQSPLCFLIRLDRLCAVSMCVSACVCSSLLFHPFPMRQLWGHADAVFRYTFTPENTRFITSI